MSEETVRSIPYVCPNCEAQVGVLVPVNGGVRLDVGGWLIGDGVRYCSRCGRLIHFKAPRDEEGGWAEVARRYAARRSRAAGGG